MTPSPVDRLTDRLWRFSPAARDAERLVEETVEWLEDEGPEEER